MARVVITGATGTIGSELARALVARGDEVVALTRDPQRARGVLPAGAEALAWAAPLEEPPPGEALAGADAIVHLLGEPVDQRWTARAKQAIRDSRVRSTELLVEALRTLPESARPGVLVSQSAAGYYGPRGDEPLDESAAAGDDFLAGVVREWEAAAQGAEDLVRVVRMRTGVVLSTSGGALSRMLPFFRAGVGGPVAGGRQQVPWVHLADVVGALVFAIDTTDLSGAVNVAAPQPATNAELSRALGRVLRRPAFLPVPGLALRALYGEMAMIVLTGQALEPAKLLTCGYEFRFPALEPALADVLR
jgi:uncharacterized protein (TIGR01777 family)